MWGLGISYDLLIWERDIIRKGFRRHAFESLKESGSMVHETEGPNADCWVVPLRDLPEFADLQNPDKVLARSNGTATYVAKDIAYQLWRSGALGLDYDQRLLRSPARRHTSPQLVPTRGGGGPSYGTELRPRRPGGERHRRPPGVPPGRAPAFPAALGLREGSSKLRPLERPDQVRRLGLVAAFLQAMRNVLDTHSGPAGPRGPLATAPPP
jgi:hypothetical protein